MAPRFPAVDETGRLSDTHLPTRLEPDHLAGNIFTTTERAIASATAPRPLDMDRMTADNALAPITTPTYDGSGQAVHPSVVHIPGGFGPQGFPYWMGMTPYPNDDVTVENPSILASYDGETWVVPDGMVNPIAQPETQYYPDPDLTYDPATGRLYCVWFYAIGGARHFVSWTQNGYEWSEPFAFTTEAAVSPSVLREGGGLTLWDVGKGGGTVNRVRRRTGPDFHQVWDTPWENCDLTLPTGREAWHIEVQKIGAHYIALISAGRVDGASISTDLFVATSHDGRSWSVRTQPLIARSADGWDNSHIYRASLLPTEGTGDQLGVIYYSARSLGSQWGIAKTPLIMSTPGMDGKASLTSAAMHTNTIESRGSTRNLYRNSTLLRLGSGGLPEGCLDYTGDKGSFSVDVEKDAFAMTVAAPHIEAGSVRGERFDVTEGETYALSVEATTDRDGHGVNARLLWMDASNGFLLPTRARTIYPPAGVFGRIKLVAQAPAGATAVRVSFHGSDSQDQVTYFFRRVQFEKGASVTEWTPGVATRTVAAGGQAGNLSEWLSPTTEAGQTVLSAVTAQGIFNPPKLPTSELPPPGGLQGSVVWDTTVGALVMSTGAAWVTIATS